MEDMKFPRQTMENAQSEQTARTENSQEHFLPIKELGELEQTKSIDEVFSAHPELENIGTKSEYKEYLRFVFPESVLKQVMWHGVRKDKLITERIYKEGFSKEASLSDEHTLEFYGFYFGDRYSHYGGPRMDSVAAIVNIKNPYFINIDFDGPRLSSLDLTAGLKKTYGLDEEDGIIQVGDFHGNDNISREDKDKHTAELENRWSHLASENPTVLAQEIVNFTKEHGFDSLPLQEVVVLDASQIHVLGSPSDIEAFKTFKSGSKQ